MELKKEEIEKIQKKDDEFFKKEEESSIEATLIVIVSTTIVFAIIYVYGFTNFMSIFKS